MDIDLERLALARKARRCTYSGIVYAEKYNGHGYDHYCEQAVDWLLDNADLGFDNWVDDYIRRQYPFYTADAAMRVGCTIKGQLKDAWIASRAASMAAREKVGK